MTELVLVESSGFALSDLRGRESVETRYREQTGIVASIRRRVSWLADPEPIREAIKITEPGLLDREVEEFAILHDERVKMKNKGSSDNGNATMQTGDSPMESSVPNTTNGMLM